MKSLLVWRPVYESTDCLYLFIAICFPGARRERGANTLLRGELPPTRAGLWWDCQAGYRLKKTDEILGNQSAGTSLNS